MSARVLAFVGNSNCVRVTVSVSVCLVAIMGIDVVGVRSLDGTLAMVLCYSSGEERSCTGRSGLLVTVGYHYALLLQLKTNKNFNKSK